MMTQGMKIAVSGIALIMAITVCEPAEAQVVSQAMNLSERGSGTGSAGSVPGSTATGPTLEAAGSSGSFENPFAAFDTSKNNTSAQNSGMGIGDSYFELNPLKKMENVKAAVGAAAADQFRNDLTKDEGYQKFSSDKVSYGFTESPDALSQTNKAIYISPTDTSAEAKAYRDTVSKLEQTQAKINTANKEIAAAEEAKAAAEQNLKDIADRKQFYEKILPVPVTQYQTEAQEKKEQAMAEKEAAIKARDKAKLALSNAKSKAEVARLTQEVNDWEKKIEEARKAESDWRTSERDLSKAAETYKAYLEAEAAEEAAAKAAIKKAEETITENQKKIEENTTEVQDLTKQAQSAAAAYVEKNPNAVMDATEATYKATATNNELKYKEMGFETDGNGKILINDKNRALYEQITGGDAGNKYYFEAMLSRINEEGATGPEYLKNHLAVKSALNLFKNEAPNEYTTVNNVLHEALVKAGGGTLDMHNLNKDQKAILERVQSWKEQNDKRKAAGQDPISFEDYVNQGGLERDVVIYKETKPKIESMAGKWHQMVDKDYGGKVSQRLNDTGIVVKIGSGSGKTQVESSFE